MRILAILALAAMVSMADGRAAHAAAWCAWYDKYTYNCGFYTFAQCLATISGIGGFCRRNVYEPWSPAEPLVRRHKRVRHHR